jgi:hypothetical protein
MVETFIMSKYFQACATERRPHTCQVRDLNLRYCFYTLQRDFKIAYVAYNENSKQCKL